MATTGDFAGMEKIEESRSWCVRPVPAHQPSARQPFVSDQFRRFRLLFAGAASATLNAGVGSVS